MTQPIKIDIDGPSGLWLLTFAKRQLARVKTLVPFGIRRWAFPTTGEELTIWWGTGRDRIRITSQPGKPWRDVRQRYFQGSGGFFTRFFRGKATNITVKTDVFTSATTPTLTFPTLTTPYADANWSKDGSTFVSMVCDNSTLTGTMTITRGNVTVQVPNVMTGFPSFISPNTIGFLTYEISDELHPFSRLNNTLELFIISKDGQRVIAHSSNTLSESFVIADWDETNATYQITRVALPPVLADVVALPAPFQPFNFPAGNLDGMYYQPTDAPWGGTVYVSGAGQTVATSDITHRLPLLHFASTNKVYYYFRATTQLAVSTIVSGQSGSDKVPFTWYSIDGVTNDRMMVYDVPSRTWSVLRNRDEAFKQLRLVGNVGQDTTATNLASVPGEIYWHLLLKADGTAQVLHTPGVRQPQSVQLAVRDVNNNRIIVATVTMPGSTGFLLAPQPVLDDASATVLSDSGIDSFSTPPKTSAWRSADAGRCLYRTSTGQFWRWGSDATQVIDIGSLSDAFMDKSGQWLFVTNFIQGFSLLPPRVYFKGVLIWDAATALPDGTYNAISFSGSSTEREGFAAARLSTIPSNVVVHAMVSFQQQLDGTYKVVAESSLDSTSALVPGSEAFFNLNPFSPRDAIADECYHSPIRT